MAFPRARADEHLGKKHVSQRALIAGAYKRRAVGVSQLFSPESRDFWAFSLTPKSRIWQGKVFTVFSLITDVVVN